MELEEMKTQWNEMSAEIKKQKRITDTLVIKMTHARYKGRLNSVLIPEAVGLVGCFAMVLFIIINLEKLHTAPLLVCGIASAFILFLMPILSIKAVCKLRSLHISGNNYKQSLLEYSKAKIQFVFIQKLNFVLGSVLMLTILPVVGQLINGKDLFAETRLWLWYAVGFPFYYFFARWVKKCYIKSASAAENILKELSE